MVPHQALPWQGQPYSIKRHGVSITNCDAEPVQTPGCVQAHGAVLVLRASDLTILQVSENAPDILGRTVDFLLGKPCAVVLGDGGESRLKHFLQTEQTHANPLFLISLSAFQNVPMLDITMHTLDGVVILEFERTGRMHGDAIDYFGLVKKTITRLQSSDGLLPFCQIVTDDFRELTGLDRVMVYRFHADNHGEVFAESKRDDLDPWLGLHYPADDIPQPARDIFKKIWVRPVPDVGGALAELVPLANPDTGLPLQMTYCALRGPSLMYTEYLHNMHVAACLTMPIRRDGKLWGLIACHHYARTKPMPYQLRAASEFLAQVVSMQVANIDDRQHLRYRLAMESTHERLVARASNARELSTIASGSPSLLDAVNASGAAMFYNNTWQTMGRTPATAELSPMLEWIQAQMQRDGSSTQTFVTDALCERYPPATTFADVASGLVAISISRRRNDFLLWFRPELLRTINWAGNPHDKPTQPGPNGARLTPRHSFALFVESVKGRSAPWSTTEVEALGRFRAMILELVVNHADELAGLNAKLLRSNEELDAFAYLAGHDLKEPLRGIHRYVDEMQQETLLAETQRVKLAGMTRLAARMDRLLDSLLDFARVGRAPATFFGSDLNEIVKDAIEMVSSRTVSAHFVLPRPLPVMECDYGSMSEIFVNLFSNALKYNDSSVKTIEVGYIARDENFDRTSFPERALSSVVLYVRDNGIGIASEYFEQIFRMFKRLHSRDEYGGGSGAGLTIVKKMVERHNGRVWLESSPGTGTTFYFDLPGQ